MADINRTIEIIFGAVDSGVSDAVNNISNSLSLFDRGVQGIADPLAQFTENLLKAEAAVGALALAYGGYAVNEAAKFQTAQIDLNKVLADGDPPIESFTATVKDLSNQYGISSATVLQGIANFRQAGFTAAEAAGLQKNALDLVIAGDIDAQNASELLVASLKGFNEQASAAPRYLEALNNVSNDYATDVQQLAEGVSRVSPIMHTMGFSFEETTGVMTPMIEVFRSGNLAADALKTGLLRLIDDSRPVTDALAKLGVSQFDLNGQMRSGKDIFYDVANAFTTLDQNQKLVFASQLFGIEQAPKLMLAFDNIAKVTEVTNSALAVTGSVAKEVDLRLASTAISVERFKVGFENLAIAIGQQFMSQFTGVVVGANAIELAFTQIVEGGGLAPFFDAIRPALTDFGVLLTQIAHNLPAAFEGVDFSGLITAFRGLASEFGQVFDQIFNSADLSTVEGLQSAIQTSVNILTALVNITRSIVDEFSPIFAAIGEAGRQLDSSSTASQSALGQFLGAMTILGDFGTLFGTTLLVIKASGSDITNVFNTVQGGAAVFSNVLQLAFDGAAFAIVELFAKISGGIAWLGEALGLDSLAAPFRAQATELEQLGSGIEESFKANATDLGNAWNTMTNGLSGGANNAKESLGEFGQATDDLKNKLADSWQGASRMAEMLITMSGSSTGAKNGLDSMGASAGITVDQFDRLTAIEDQLNSKMKDTVKATDDTAKMTAELAAGYYQVGHAVEGTTNVFTQQSYKLGELALGHKLVAEAMDGTKDATDKLTDREKLVIENTQKTTEKLMELASNEKIKSMEFNVQLNIAQLNAQVKEVEAAFTTIQEFYKENAAVINSLVSGFNGSTNNMDKEFFKDMIQQQLSMEQQVVDSQNELNDSIAELNRAYASSLLSDTVVRIDSDGLEPSMEAFMMEILKKIQTHVVGSRSAFLLGAS
jgi:TP901 family phage tail tape measure protein